MASIFTKIVVGEIPAYKVAETDQFLAFLDVMPLVEGHVLVIPKEEIDYVFDLEDELYVALQLFAKKVAVGLKKAIPCKRIGVAVIGLEVPHTHIHLVPLQTMDDINFTRKKMSIPKERMEELQKMIKDQINS
jgi:histidine triad (HIT) family protein